MENQEAYNPKEEYLNVQQEIHNGNVEMAHKWANGDYKELREQASSFVETPVEVPTEEFVDIADNDTTTELPVDNKEEDIPFDQEAHDRAVYDAEVASYEARIAETERLAQERHEAAEEAKKREEKLLKELEETRRANDPDEDDFFGVNEPVEPVVETTHEAPVSDDKGLQELKSELEQIKRQQAEKTEWEDTVKSYNSFWESDVGKQMTPKGNRETAMKDFNNFYAGLADGLNDRDALRLMYDIRKNGINDFYTAKLNEVGMTVPDNFETMYDSLEVQAFANGQVIDPKLGKFVDSGRGKFNSLEDAYFIKNKDSIVASARKESFDEIQGKLRQKQNAAVQVNPNKYAPISTEMQKTMNPQYRQNLIAKAHSLGYDGGSLNSIRDPQVKKEMQELHANIRAYRNQ